MGMNRGTIRSPEQGKRYRIRQSDGQIEEYVYEGFGEYMKQIWRNVNTGHVVADLPPYSEHEEV